MGFYLLIDLQLHRKENLLGLNEQKRVKSGSFSGRPVNNWTRWTDSLCLSSSFKSEIAGRFLLLFVSFFYAASREPIERSWHEERKKTIPKKSECCCEYDWPCQILPWAALELCLGLLSTDESFTSAINTAATYFHILGFQPISHPNPNTSPISHFRWSMEGFYCPTQREDNPPVENLELEMQARMCYLLYSRKF